MSWVRSVFGVVRIVVLIVRIVSCAVDESELE
jgi:hypothetical protein